MAQLLTGEDFEEILRDTAADFLGSWTMETANVNEQAMFLCGVCAGSELADRSSDPPSAQTQLVTLMRSESPDMQALLHLRPANITLIPARMAILLLGMLEGLEQASRPTPQTETVPQRAQVFLERMLAAGNENGWFEMASSGDSESDDEMQ
jgi:hypothetical protein